MSPATSGRSATYNAVRTCEGCGDWFIGRWSAKYCSRECSRDGQRKHVTCTKVGCDHPHLARGLCLSHYAKTYYSARTVEVPCGWCGKTCTKRADKQSTYSQRFCSLGCRDGHRLFREGRNATPISRRHPAHPDYVPPLPVRWLAPPPKQPASRVFAGGWCVECGSPFLAEDYTATARWCSMQCGRRYNRRLRKARELSAGGQFSLKQLMALFRLFDQRCAYCAGPVDGQPHPDHVIPLSRGGGNGIENILPACPPCNHDKHALALHEWSASRAKRGLPPRITTWDLDDPRYRHLTMAPQGRQPELAGVPA